MNKRYYKGHYGSSACIAETRKGWRLTASSSGGRFWNKVYSTYRGARIALGKLGDGGRELASLDV